MAVNIIMMEKRWLHFVRNDTMEGDSDLGGALSPAKPFPKVHLTLVIRV